MTYFHCDTISCESVYARHISRSIGDKREYPAYYRMLMGDDTGQPLVESGAFLLADNILWSGKVVAPVARNDLHTQRILEFNRTVADDPRVENVIVPLRDGLNLIRVK